MKKNFYVQYNIGRAKYCVSSHDGEKTHRDGSAFYDLHIFKNKKDLKKCIDKLRAEGYSER